MLTVDPSPRVPRPPVCDCDTGGAQEASGAGAMGPSAKSAAGVLYAGGTASVNRTDLESGGEGPAWDPRWSWSNVDGAGGGAAGGGATFTQAPHLLAMNGANAN